MDSVHWAICAARSAAGIASSLRWSKVSPPRQPLRSAPLKRALNPGGGFTLPASAAEGSAAAPCRQAALSSMRIKLVLLKQMDWLGFIVVFLPSFGHSIKLFRAFLGFS